MKQQRKQFFIGKNDLRGCLQIIAHIIAARWRVDNTVGSGWKRHAGRIGMRGSVDVDNGRCIRQDQLRCAGAGNAQTEAKSICGDLPLAHIQSKRREELGFAELQPAIGLRCITNLLEARSGRDGLQACHMAIHPFQYSTVCVMVKGVHFRIGKCSVGMDAIPAFPDRCRAVFYLIKPAGIFA